MKKHNFNIFAKASFLLLILIAFAACKTVPAVSNVDAIELLDNKSAFYIAIPKAADPEFIKRIIQNNITNISESDADMLTEHISKVYCGLTRTKNHTEVQASIEDSFPLKLVPKVLSKKNGWNSTPVLTEASNKEYKVYDNGAVELAFPSETISCLGRNTKDMILKYDAVANMNDKTPGTFCSDLNDDLLNYLKGAENEIRFYANKPQSFLTILTGAQLDLKLIDVKGAFIQDPQHENQYLLDIDFNFKNATFMKAGRALLTLAFGLTNSQSIVYNESGLKITGIKLDKKQLYKLLVL